MGSLILNEGVAVVGLGTEEGGEGFRLFVGGEDFRGAEPSEFVLEAGEIGEFGDGELSGGVVGAGEAPGFAVEKDGGEIVWAGVVEEGEVVNGAGGNDLGDFAFDDFSGLGFGGLLGDGDSFFGADEFGDVALCGVVGDAAHGDAVALGESDVEDSGGDFSVFEKHFVEVTEAVEEKDVSGERPPHGLILGHHGG